MTCKFFGFVSQLWKKKMNIITHVLFSSQQFDRRSQHRFAFVGLWINIVLNKSDPKNIYGAKVDHAVKELTMVIVQ